MSNDGAIPEVHVDELAPLVRSGVILIDVRMPDEYDEVHVPGATLIPLPEIPQRHAEIPDGAIYVICRSGGRSMTACEFLVRNGREATNVAGGTMGWVEAGHPVATGPEPR